MGSNGTEPRQDQLSSVSLTRNAKGGVQPEVKVYDVDAGKAQATAMKIFDELNTKYPHVADPTKAGGKKED
ncbi:MAG: hypothetical protein ABI629_21050 [bacterium]